MDGRRLPGSPLAWVRWAAGLAVLMLIVAGCRAGPTEPTEQDGILIYAAVVRRLAGPDDTFGGELEKPVLYLVRRTDDTAGDPGGAKGASVVLPGDVQAGITAALSDLPSQVVWVDRFEDVPLDEETRAVADGGVIIEVGNITVGSATRVQVPGSIYVAGLAAGGATYVVEKRSGEWVVTGTTGPVWIS
ncbi:MAG: hypothetical protein GX601_08910 [Anaerolineales bacterium]|nr:hypothetical protein [Anaerolineales bacterium]